MSSGPPPQRRPALFFGALGLLGLAPLLPGACSNSDLSAYTGGDLDAGTGSGGEPAGAGGVSGSGGSGGSGGASGTGGAAGAAVSPLRLVAPLSTSTATSKRPTMRWSLPPGVTKVHVEIFSDRACTKPVTAFDATGSSGASKTDLPSGPLFWRIKSPGVGAMGPLTSAVWELFVGHGSAKVDTASGSVLDVNGDGFADVAVGGYAALGGAGEVQVFLGSSAGVGTKPAAVLMAPEGGQFGTWLSSAGDVNGDGFADLIVGADGTGSHTGKAYVYFGGPSGLSPAPSVTLSGSEANGLFGTSVAGVGDVNGDGYGDVVVGANGVSLGAGKAYVYFGGPSGPGATAAATPSGVQANDAFGYTVASAGDVNGDGFGDIVVGAPGAGSMQLGEAYVFLGSAAGLGAPTVLAGVDALGAFGAAVASAGDVNGDGYSDVVVSNDVASSMAGKAYVYLGSAMGVSTTATSTLVGADAGGRFSVSVGSAGDVNGDGFSDLVVSAPAAAGGMGKVFVFLGGQTGLAQMGLTLSGMDPAGGFGIYAIGVGDVNGDGFSDLAVGADLSSNTTGKVYLFAGSSAGVSVQPTALSGTTPNSHFGACVARASGVQTPLPAGGLLRGSAAGCGRSALALPSPG